MVHLVVLLATLMEGGEPSWSVLEALKGTVCWFSVARLQLGDSQEVYRLWSLLLELAMK